MLERARRLLWDFGDTLCNERFIWDQGPAWRALYATFEGDGLGARWCRGELKTPEFAAAIAPDLGMPAHDVVLTMRARCADIEWHAATWAFFRARHFPQAIVTVNPDLFSDPIVPLYSLGLFADAIVTSWEAATNDKEDLCDLALEALGGGPRADALLIDNKLESVEAWRARGGLGYHYTTDRAFRADFVDGA